MKQYLLFFLLLFSLFLGACKHEAPQAEELDNPESTSFDRELAEQLGADEYGMAKYVLAFLKRGPNRNQDSLEAAEIQRAHLENITRLAEEGKLSLAGPFLDDGPIRGIYIFNVESVDEARELTNSDPAVKAGRLVMELHPWYGSAALKEVNRIGLLVAEKKI